MPVTPYFRSPLTDFSGLVITHQNHGKCADLEMKVMNCLEAYGHTRGLKMCSDLVDDFKECFLMQKQLGRVADMRAERYRQYYCGERSKKELYADPPALDSFL